MKTNQIETLPKTIPVVFFLVLLLLAATAGTGRAELIIYPAQGQSPEQQQQDEFECHQWAVQQSGFDPTKSQQTAAQGPAPKGGVVRGAAGGALVGAGIGAIAGDAKKGAKIGAGAGAVGGGVKQQQQRQQQEAATRQAQANQQAQVASYNKARGACLEGRGYTVK